MSLQLKRDIACKHINLHRLLSLRGENFRWADLVSGNLKEEKNAHSTQPVHLSGPLRQPRNSLFRYVRKQMRHRRVWGSVVYFWRKASTNDGVAEGRVLAT